MAQKGKKQFQPQKATTASVQPTRTYTSTKSSAAEGFSIFGILLIALYCFTDFIPTMGSNDNMAIEWYYVSIINIVVALFIFFNFNNYKSIIVHVITQLYSKIYLVFCAIAALSIFYAINSTEAWVCYIRILNTLVAFFNIAILLKNREKYFIYLASLISVLLFIKCWDTLTQFTKAIASSNDISTIIYNLKSSAGNKNILAASMVIKMPLMLYCIVKFKGWAKYLFSIMFITVPIAVIIINARTAYISLILEIILFIIISLFWLRKTKDVKTTSLNLALVIIPAIIAFFYTQHQFSVLEKKNEGEKSTYGSITERLGGNGLTGGSGGQRLLFWKHAISYIKDHPVMGAGVGNWKIADIPYDIDAETDFSFAKHTHNDFLQMPAEMGILGGIAFYAMFIIMLVNVFKSLKNGKSDEEKLISLVSLFMLGAYSIDAVLNFPHERPVMQIYFALTMGINLFGLHTTVKTSENLQAKPWPKLIAAASVIIALVSTYYGKLNYETSKYQYASNKELFADPNRPANFNNNDKFPGFPNLADNNYPIDVVRAYNEYHLGNYPQALKLLNGSVKVNPNSKANEYVRALIFDKIGPADSAFYYAKTSYFIRPRNMYFFRLLADLCAKRRDSNTLQEAVKKSIPYEDGTRLIDYYVYTMINIGASKQKMYEILNLAEKTWPKSEDIRYKKYYVNAIIASNKGDNKTALENLLKLSEKYPQNYVYKQDIGALYYTFNDLKKSAQFIDDVLAHKGSLNGKAEFYKANLLLLEGKREEACPYLKIAANANYPDARNFYERNNCFNVKPAQQGRPMGLPENL